MTSSMSGSFLYFERGLFVLRPPQRVIYVSLMQQQPCHGDGWAQSLIDGKMFRKSQTTVALGTRYLE